MGLSDDISYLLSFSELFFLSFEITDDREKQWLFIAHFLLEDAPHTVKSLYESDLIKKAIGGGTKYHYVKKLLADLAEKKLIQLPAGRLKRDTQLALHPEFDAAVARYVSLFLSKFGERIPEALDPLRRMPPKNIASAIFRIQVEKFYPAWQQFLDAIGSKARSLYRARNVAWPAAGSTDTELGVLMELEVGHGETTVYAGVQA